MKTEEQIGTFVGAILLAVLFIALALAIYPGVATLSIWLNSGTAASWAQAIISAAAVLAGAIAIYWQVGRQAANEAERERNSNIKRLEIIRYGFFDIRVNALILKREIGLRKAHASQMEHLKATVDRLASIPVLDIPDWKAVHAISSADINLRVLQNHLDSTRNDAVLNRTRAVENALSYINAQEEIIDKCLLRLGATSPSADFEIDDEVHHMGPPK